MLDSNQKTLKSFSELPPDIILAKLKIEKERENLRNLEKELSKKMSCLQWT